MARKPRKSRDGVGYGRPPRASQFKPGQSGNPRGRPKGSKNLAAAIHKELLKRIKISEHGRQRSVTKTELLAAQAVNKAIQDPKHMAVLLRAAGELSEDSGVAGPEVDALSKPEDSLVMESIVRRIRSMEEAPLDATACTVETSLPHTESGAKQ